MHAIEKSVNEVRCPYCNSEHDVKKPADLIQHADRVCEYCSNLLWEETGEIDTCALCERDQMVTVPEDHFGDRGGRVCLECVQGVFSFGKDDAARVWPTIVKNWPYGSCVRLLEHDVLTLFNLHDEYASLLDHGRIVTSGKSLHNPYVVSQPYQYDELLLKRYNQSTQLTAFVKPPEESFYNPHRTFRIEFRIDHERLQYFAYKAVYCQRQW